MGTVIPFAGTNRSDYSYFIERVTPPTGEAIDRWKSLKAEGWEVEALVLDDGSTMVGIGLLPHGEDMSSTTRAERSA